LGAEGCAWRADDCSLHLLGGDSPERHAFEIFVNDRKLADQTTRWKRREFFDVDYPIPEQWIEGKTSLTVKFQAHDGKVAGGVFDCQVLRPEDRRAGGAK